MVPGAFVVHGVFAVSEGRRYELPRGVATSGERPSGRVESHGRVPTAVRLVVAQNAPHSAREGGVVERDLPKYPVVPRSREANAPVFDDVLGPQREDDELVDTRQIFHEVPRIFSAAQPFVNEDGEFIGGFGTQQLEAGTAARALVVRGHQSSLRVGSGGRPGQGSLSAYAEEGITFRSARVPFLAERGEDSIQILNRGEINADLAFLRRQRDTHLGIEAIAQAFGDVIQPRTT